MSRRLAVLAAAVVIVGVSARAHAIKINDAGKGFANFVKTFPASYLKLGTEAGGRIVPTRWPQQPVRYYVTNRDVPGVSAPALQTAVARAFATWGGVRTAQVSAEFAGFTGAEPFSDDGMTVIGFRARPDLDRTLGATTFTLDKVTGAILQADIFLNASFLWSVAPAGEASRYDVESIAAHEIGHLYGLSHSALGETELLEGGRRRVTGKAAVMFPIAYPSGNILDRSLQPDDELGLSDLYGTAAFAADTGSIAGRVLLNGGGVYGAHVVAFNPSTGLVTGTFSLTPSGNFVLAGLPAGLYVVRAEPLDDADADSFFEDATVVNTNFRVGYAGKLVSVPAGGSAGAIEIAVQPK
jgi:hypothetical protein